MTQRALHDQGVAELARGLDQGAFSALEISADEANALIMQARVKAGWIEAPAEEPAPEEVVAEAEAEAQS